MYDVLRIAEHLGEELVVSAPDRAQVFGHVGGLGKTHSRGRDDDDIEGVFDVPSETLRMRQRLDDVDERIERVRPAVQQHQRHRCIAGAFLENVMKLLAVDLGDEIVKAVDPRLGTAPVVGRRPEFSELSQPLLSDAVAPGFDAFLREPAVIRERWLWNPERDRLRLAGRREREQSGDDGQSHVVPRCQYCATEGSIIRDQRSIPPASDTAPPNPACRRIAAADRLRTP